MHRRGEGVEQAAQARSGRGAGEEGLCACGGAGAERVERRRRVGAWRRSEGAERRFARKKGDERETDSRGPRNG